MDQYIQAVATAAAVAAEAAEQYREATYKAVLEAELRVGVPTVRREPLASTPRAGANGKTSVGLTAVGEHLGISQEDASLLFDIDGETVRLAFPPSKLDKTMSRGTHQVFFLICGARQLAFGAQETDMDTVRTAVIESGRYDTKNFAATLSELTGLAIFGGTPRARTYRLTRAGLETMKATATELLQKIKQIEVKT
jgi:hypothetical protein